MKHYRQKNCDVILDKFIQFVPMASSWLPAGINDKTSLKHIGTQTMFTSLKKYDDPAKLSGRYRRSKRARKTCFKGWTLEYLGYIMAGYYDNAAVTTFTCVDSHPDTLHGGSKSKEG
uniref:Uncharacterized protein n=1 Tax=Magallana gigas TaxID=29159 RepID=K1PLI9_MAGGI